MTDAQRPPFNLLGQLWFQVMLAMGIGILLGWLRPSLGEEMKPLGDGFIALVRMMIGPIIFCTVVHGIAGMNDMRRVGRVAFKTLIYFEVVTTIALIIALVAVNLWRPGAGMNIDPAALDESAIASFATQAREQGLVQFFSHIIPRTLISAFAEGEILQVLLISVLFGFALCAVGKPARPVAEMIERLSQVLFKMISFIMYVAPIGAFGAIAFTVGRFGAKSLLPLIELIVEYYTVCLVFLVIVLGGIARWTGVSLWRLLLYIREEILIVAGTSSSETVLPRIMQKLRGLGCEESVVGLVIPTGYSFNLDGTCLYLATATIFLAQATNIEMGIDEQIGLLLILLATSKGAAGVAGAALVVLTATLATFGTLPLASVALLLGIHRSMGELISITNMIGNTVATIVIAKWDKAVDLETLYSQVGVRGNRTPLKTAEQRSE